MARNYKQQDVWEFDADADAPFFPHERNVNKQCNATHDGWACTRTAGHVAPHAAHGSGSQQFATWED